MTHSMKVCKHGKVLGQCRCPAPDKVKVFVDCPLSCLSSGDPVLYAGTPGSTAHRIEAPSSFSAVFENFKTETPLTVERLVRALEKVHTGLREDFNGAWSASEQRKIDREYRLIGSFIEALEDEG